MDSSERGAKKGWVQRKHKRLGDWCETQNTQMVTILFTFVFDEKQSPTVVTFHVLNHLCQHTNMKTPKVSSYTSDLSSRSHWSLSAVEPNWSTQVSRNVKFFAIIIGQSSACLMVIFSSCITTGFAMQPCRNTTDEGSGSSCVYVCMPSGVPP